MHTCCKFALICALPWWPVLKKIGYITEFMVGWGAFFFFFFQNCIFGRFDFQANISEHHQIFALKGRDALAYRVPFRNVRVSW